MNCISSLYVSVLDLVERIDALYANIEKFREHERDASAAGELIKREIVHITVYTVTVRNSFVNSVIILSAILDELPSPSGPLSD